MSAFLCETDTFDLLASAIERLNIRVETPTRTFYGRSSARVLAQILRDENLASLQYKYNDEEDAPAYSPEFVDLDMVGLERTGGWMVVVLAAIRCVQYQSCERPDYATSVAAHILQQLQQAVIRQMIEDANAPWEWTRRHEAARQHPQDALGAR